MYELTLLAAFATPEILTAAYWLGLIIGGGLVIVSALGALDGGADVDVDGGFDFEADADVEFEIEADADFDLDADVSHAAHAAEGATALTTWFSMRFLVFCVAVFGAAGVIFTYMSELATWTVFYVALIAGLIVGQAVHQIFLLIRRTSGDSTPRPRDYVNRLGRVTMAIKNPDKGEIALQIRGSRRNVPAVSRDDVTDFDAGDEVVVVGYRAGVARVISRAAFEDMHANQKGEI